MPTVSSGISAGAGEDAALDRDTSTSPSASVAIKPTEPNRPFIASLRSPKETWLHYKNMNRTMSTS
jgi:hypothetical protein